MNFLPNLQEPVHTDCRWYRGHLPCKPHKEHGVHCEGCKYYEPIVGDLLIIKLGAMGDVMRTTPLLRRLKKEFPQHRIHWLTDFPDAVPGAPWVDRIYKLDTRSMVQLEQLHFDRLFCLDKDPEAAAVATKMEAHKKYGYVFHNGVVHPFGIEQLSKQASQHKWLTGLFDDSSKTNTLSYQQEIFAICGYDFAGEEYIMPAPVAHGFALPPPGKRIGLNTGCGGRWSTRLYPEEHWVALIKLLQARGYAPVLLGGPEEDERNKKLHAATQAVYYGTMALNRFDALLSELDAVVTAVTMAMHLAIGRQRPLVLFNNIFNRHEFELYGRGEILEPEPPCKCYYAQHCEYGGCMDRIAPERVLEAVDRIIGK